MIQSKPTEDLDLLKNTKNSRGKQEEKSFCFAIKILISNEIHF